MTIYSKPVLSACGAMKNSLYKGYNKVYFPFPTAVCGVTGTFTITFDGTLMFFERLYSTLFERAKYYFKKKQTA